MNKSSLVKPFLRWAGGKSWLIKHLEPILNGRDFNNYHEPFIGGAAVFLAVSPENQSYLSDLNEDLINTYKVLKKSPSKLISELGKYENTEDFYYYIRGLEVANKIERAARFIYLNQTSFNGIYRVNLSGKYNVPYGHRSKGFLEEDKLYQVSKSLKDATLQVGDFEIVKNNLEQNDLIFLDPPYTVSHNNNGFIKYNQKLFTLEDQYRLSELIDYIKEKGAYYILTNAAHQKIREIFTKDDLVVEKSRSNLIGGSNAKRGHTSEFLFTNIK
jgi:DNA adenine methylase